MFFDKIKKWWEEKEEQHRIRCLNRESVECPYCEEKYTPNLIYKYTTKAMDLISNKEKMRSMRNRYVKCFKCDKVFGIEENHYYAVEMIFIRYSFAIE